MKKFFLSEYGLHPENTQSGKWCDIFESIFKFPLAFIFWYTLFWLIYHSQIVHFDNIPIFCAFCVDIKFRKSILAKIWSFASILSAHWLTYFRDILSSNQKPPFCSEISKFLHFWQRKKTPKWGKMKIWVSFTQNRKYDDDHSGKLVSITVLQTKSCIFTENCLMCTHQAHNREFLNVKNLIWTPGENIWRANFWV